MAGRKEVSSMKVFEMKKERERRRKKGKVEGKKCLNRGVWCEV